MERVERNELPGNDASWYRALLVDTNEEQLDPEQVAVDVETAEVTEVTEETERVSESTVVHVAVATAAAAATVEDAPVENAGSETATPTDPDQDAATPGDVPVEEPEDAASSTDGETPLVSAVPAVETDVDDEPLDNTSEMVGQLWTAGETDSPLDTWEPDDMNRTISSSRSFRWTSIVGALAIVALIVVGLVLLPSVAQGRADDHMDMFASVLRDLRGELPDTQRSLEVATDPASEVTDLSELSTQLTELAAKASAVDAAAQADLPSAPPFTSSGPVDDLEPIRQQIEPLGTVANSIQRRIANLVEYRILMDGFLKLPELPYAADAGTQAELRVTLAAAQAESASILADLPVDEALQEHRELARSTNERFATWQVEYLEALRTEDVAGAQALLTELDDSLTSLDSALVAPLAEIRRDTDAAIINLARSIDGVLSEINGST